MNLFSVYKTLLAAAAASLLVACAVSPETQAKMDEFARTIPTCSSSAECQSKWDMARAWVEANADFGIRSSTDERIISTTNLASDAGIGIDVRRIDMGGGTYQILVDLECIRAYGCSELWDMMVEFNQVVGAAR